MEEYKMKYEKTIQIQTNTYENDIDMTRYYNDIKKGDYSIFGAELSHEPYYDGYSVLLPIIPILDNMQFEYTMTAFVHRKFDISDNVIWTGDVEDVFQSWGFEDVTTTNTYNYDNDLESIIQSCTAIDTSNNRCYVALQIHLGGDARGNYSDVAIFSIDDEYEFYTMLHHDSYDISIQTNEKISDFFVLNGEICWTDGSVGGFESELLDSISTVVENNQKRGVITTVTVESVEY